MIGFATPAWLLGLLVLPLVRAWHRRRAPAVTQQVPALFLWPTGGPAEPPGARTRQPPDPVWRRRALLITLLLLALAGPQGGDGPPLVVWLDARPSLLAREADGRRRAEHGAEALAAALREARVSGVVLLRPLNAPGPGVPIQGLTGAALGKVIADLAGTLSADADGGTVPPSAQPAWLLSDGSGPRVDPPGGYQRVIAVGAAQDNAGIVGLAARALPAEEGPASGGPPGLVALVTLYQAGPSPSHRRLRLLAGAEELLRRELTLPAGQPWPLRLPLPGVSATRLTARLEPADALAEDDQLTLSVDPLAPVAVRQAGPCPPAVAAALAANPRLQRTGSPALVIHCGEQPPPVGPATLWVRAGPAQASAAAPLWAADLTDAPAPDPQWQGLAVTPMPGSRVWLAAGGRPLLLGSPNRLELLLDLRDPGPRWPLLLDWLVARLTDTPTLGEPVAVARPLAQVAIAPGPLPAPRAAKTPAPTPSATGAMAALLVAALGLALVELKSRRPLGDGR